MPIDLDYIKTINRSKSCKNSKEVKVKEFVNQYDKTISSTVTKFDLLINTSKAEEVKLNNASYKALISYKRVKDAVEDALVRKIQMNSGIMKYGDYIEYIDKNGQKNIYIIKTKIEPKMGYDETLIKACNNSLKLKTKINNKEEVIEIPCIIGAGTYSIDEFKNMSIPNNHLQCEVGYSMKDKLKYINDTDNPTRFVINGRAYKVANLINNITKMIGNEGLYLINLESCIKVPEDNLDLGIAYNEVKNTNDNKPNPTDKPTTSIYSIEGSDTLNSKTIQTYTIINQNGNIVTDKEFKFKFEKADYNTPASLYYIKNMTNNSINLLGSKTKGEFILVVTCKSDESIVIKKNIKVVVE